MTFLSKDKKIEIRAFGNPAVEDFDRLDQQFKIATADLRITYKKITADWFIFSGIDKQGKIVYRKTKRNKTDYMGTANMYVFIH